MKRTHFGETQIGGIQQQADVVIKVNELCRAHGISEATYYDWKA